MWNGWEIALLFVKVQGWLRLLEKDGQWGEKIVEKRPFQGQFMNFLNSEDAENYFYKFYQKISDEITLQIYSPKGSDKRFGRIIASGIKDANPGATVSAKSLAKSFATLNSDDRLEPRTL